MDQQQHERLIFNNFVPKSPVEPASPPVERQVLSQQFYSRQEFHRLFSCYFQQGLRAAVWRGIKRGC